MEASKGKYTNRFGDTNMAMDSNCLFNDERKCEFFDDYSNRKLFNHSNMAGGNWNYDTYNPEYTMNPDLKFLERYPKLNIKKPETVERTPDPQFVILSRENPRRAFPLLANFDEEPVYVNEKQFFLYLMEDTTEC